MSSVCGRARRAFIVRRSLRMEGKISSELKGIWWMPWHREAMKDVALCEKPWGGESTL
jgi:hypothetical protein